MKRKPKPTEYRVEIRMLDAGGVYQNWYTSTDRAMAEGIATSLKRVGNPGRLVQLPGGEILDTWEKGT